MDPTVSSGNDISFIDKSSHDIAATTGTRKRRSDEMDPSSSKRTVSSGFKVTEAPQLPDHLEIPPLPPIRNKAIERKAFTHPSLNAAIKKGVRYMEDEDDLEDNEKLEWVGDGLLSESA